ncbi:HK97-gp10 family putative phage morphogenesis protein [Cellulosilyticum sp. I15G10I2]|uniref:HK97-gp10 family putative phage morphogenesis protein n=1 Tax=Cellulosilyticum sp. I15G10I2 TaxID=1892843 RepID=UPI00085CD908|nr:HK97-gp10 family putative phage morphogenesis protein [Cellulosilyticum sp. I15G10I2]
MNNITINLANFINKILPETIEKGLEKAGQLIENEAKIQLTEGKNKAIDTGTLRASITHKVDNDNMSVSIGTNVEYAPAVHSGTSKMRERPYLQDAVDQNMTEIINCFRE